MAGRGSAQPAPQPSNEINTDRQGHPTYLMPKPRSPEPHATRGSGTAVRILRTRCGDDHALLQHRRVRVDAVDAEAGRLLERGELFGDALDEIGQHHGRLGTGRDRRTMAARGPRTGIRCAQAPEPETAATRRPPAGGAKRRHQALGAPSAPRASFRVEVLTFTRTPHGPATLHEAVVSARAPRSARPRRHDLRPRCRRVRGALSSSHAPEDRFGRCPPRPPAARRRPADRRPTGWDGLPGPPPRPPGLDAHRHRREHRQVFPRRRARGRHRPGLTRGRGRNTQGVAASSGLRPDSGRAHLVKKTSLWPSGSSKVNSRRPERSLRGSSTGANPLARTAP